MWHKRRKGRQPNHQIDCESLLASILLAATIGLIGGTGSGAGCPEYCECKWSNGKETVNCDHKLDGIPVGIPSATQTKPTLATPGVFRDISDDSFLQLTNLVEIDLCDNSLEYIPTVSLQKCKSLRKLSLCVNPIRTVRSDSFANLNSLVTIDLSLCQIETIDANAFKGLQELRSLRLDANRLRTLSVSALIGLHGLHALHLHQNPWHCDCQLRHTVEWLTRNTVPQTLWPTCKTPHRIEGYSWHTLNLDEFSCSPVIHTQLTHFHSNIGQNLTIYCTVSGFPMPSISWKFGVDAGGDPRDRTNVSLDDDKRFLIEKVAVNETFVSSYITINDLQLHDSQQLICLAANKGGSAHKNFSVTVSQTSHTLDAVIDLPKFRIVCYIIGLVIAFILVVILFVMPLIRSKRCSSVRTSTLSPKLGPIDILQNVKNSDLEMKTILTNKPEIALISDIIRDTTGLKPYRFGSDPLTTPDVANFGPHYSAQPPLTASNRSSIISTSVSFDTFRSTPPPLLHSQLPVLDSSEPKVVYNNHSNGAQQQYDNRFHYTKLNTISVMNNKSQHNGVNECQKLYTFSANHMRDQTMSAVSDMTSSSAPELKPFLSHSQSHCLALDKELASDLKATQNLLTINANNSISVTQV
ncbi:unnamed protein product [Oppiella nova]|uniref:Ig-like domain-containing protein n=1 Tax=Oppiella nova TaxID=334625 RepID=A0A7R9QBL0_9ACAR|nr:unnamed protein product [Oppiella nova]CAG2161622.1 unnamed protein product [Oppiella nova]